MLSDAFLDWWFAPWDYAGDPPGLVAGADLLARRDQYGPWCAAAGIEASLPGVFDPGWQVAATHSGAELRQTARLFGGLVAARARIQPVLDGMALDERRWCMSVALTQPLAASPGLAFDPAAAADGDLATVLGLAELAHRLAHGFPGAWPRLRLLLPAALDECVTRLAPPAPATEPATAAPQARAQRCWQMCRARAALAAAS